MDSPIISKFCDYIINHHKPDLVEILKSPDETASFSVIINFLTLFEESIDLGNGLLEQPEKYLSEFNNATVVAQEHLLADLNDPGECKTKLKVFVRITALPLFDETCFPSNDDIGSFIKIIGTLIKVGAPKLLEYQRDYTCKKCHHINKVHAKYERYYAITAPNKCEECHSTNLILNKETNVSHFRDYQEVKIQEHFGRSKVGTVPHAIWVTLENNLVDTCKPGDDVAITGVVMRRWRPFKADMRYDIDLVIKANNLEICNEQKSIASSEEVKEAFVNFWQHYKNRELEGRNHLLKSFCPQIFGMYLAKLAMVIVLAGGVQKVDENGCSTRGVSHLLLVGDAGTGKSHLLRYASKISERSVFTTGVGSTTAGLTVSAVRENGDWNLEAGALVLADGGVCCIDDFSTVREHDRTSIHEAMEQQSISVAKAGIVTKLHTRCSIFATTGPKGKYDCSVPMNVNVGISSPLLSRFDIVLILLDSKSPNWDMSLCDFIFNGGGKTSSSQEAFAPSTKGQTLATDIWSTSNLQNYFTVVKRMEPVMSQDAGTILRAYYHAQRLADSRNAARTTVRLLESLIRLSQGHARLMFRDEVTVLDAIVAITLVESSLQSSSITSGVNALHTVFPEDPYAEYISQAETILTKLNLKDILNREMEEIEKGRTDLLEGEINGGNNYTETSSAKEQDGVLKSKNEASVKEDVTRTNQSSTAKRAENEEKQKAAKRAAELSLQRPFGVESGDELHSTGTEVVERAGPSHVFAPAEKSKRMKLAEDEDGEGLNWLLDRIETSPERSSGCNKVGGKKNMKKNVFALEENESWSDLDL